MNDLERSNAGIHTNTQSRNVHATSVLVPADDCLIALTTKLHCYTLFT